MTRTLSIALSQAVAANPADAVARRGLMISYANLAAADPNDQLAQYDLANPLLRYGWLEPASNQREASLATLRQAEEIFRRPLAADPKSISTARSMSLAQE